MSSASIASPTSQYILQPSFRFYYATSSSLNSPGEPPMRKTDYNHTMIYINRNRSPIQMLCTYFKYLEHGYIICIKYIHYQISGGPVVIILATGSEVRGFKPGRGRWISSEHKNPEYDFLWKGSKAMGPM